MCGCRNDTLQQLNDHAGTLGWQVEQKNAERLAASVETLTAELIRFRHQLARLNDRWTPTLSAELPAMSS